MTVSMSENCKSFFQAFGTHLEKFDRPNDEEGKQEIRDYDKCVRRLDSLARLIVNGDGTNCVAVALVNDEWYFTANKIGTLEKSVRKTIK
ncbi:hypothetical protein PNK_p0139 (plasmid) [Candidatus Protochlamydia naegleriophila]|uniref:Uncharacterized protein n=1 Tax=Candidatus Protochlamydia naegleriophila TaxID=389348 RepID=A0A0U5JIC8_9BACT|nr:hypothetical protein [Candidatus Protochlamydia naegleriophila]CUI18191.1 hypothetical protein PNK_p0139 [Candidatus Protochlamydia naegleriophila]